MPGQAQDRLFGIEQKQKTQKYNAVWPQVSADSGGWPRVVVHQLEQCYPESNNRKPCVLIPDFFRDSGVFMRMRTGYIGKLRLSGHSASRVHVIFMVMRWSITRVESIGLAGLRRHRCLCHRRADSLAAMVVKHKRCAAYCT